MEALYQSNSIVMRDLHSVYEALFLRTVTSFEVFLEEQFIATLSGRAQYDRRRVSLRMTAVSRQALMDIILQGDRYLTWLPFSQTEDRAKIYLKDDKPFSELTDGDKSMMRTITTIRNAIAHRSRHATSEFKRTVIGNRPMLSGEKSPAGFFDRRPVRHQCGTGLKFTLANWRVSLRPYVRSFCEIERRE